MTVVRGLSLGISLVSREDEAHVYGSGILCAAQALFSLSRSKDDSSTEEVGKKVARTQQMRPERSANRRYNEQQSIRA